MNVLVTFFTPQQQVQTNHDNNCTNYAETELYEYDFFFFYFFSAEIKYFKEN